MPVSVDAFDQLIQSISPGVSLFTVIATFSAASFWAGKFFWALERDLNEGQVEKLKELVTGFRARHIEPTLIDQYKESRATAFNQALRALQITSLDEDGQFDTQVISQALTNDKIKEAVRNFKEEDDAPGDFISSASGQGLMDKIEQLFEEIHNTKDFYNCTGKYCIRSAYFFFLFTAISLLGLMKLMFTWPRVLWHFWWFALCFLAVGAFMNVVLMEINKRKLFRKWQRFHVYSEL